MLLIFQTSFQLLAIPAKEQFLNWLRYIVCVIHLKEIIQVYVFPLKNSDVTINLFSWHFFPLLLLILFNWIKICNLSHTHINITDSIPLSISLRIFEFSSNILQFFPTHIEPRSFCQQGHQQTAVGLDLDRGMNPHPVAPAG